MRANCARVLAAALLTAAISTVVGMSALFGTPSEAGRPIAAPPSKLQRSVRLTAHFATPHSQAARLVTTHTNRQTPSARTEVINRSLVVVRKRKAAHRSEPRQLTDVKPAAEPEPAPAPSPPAQPAPPVTPDDGDDQAPGHGHGRGHAHGHDKQDE
jgi:hypothetical protein